MILTIDYNQRKQKRSRCYSRLVTDKKNNGIQFIDPGIHPSQIWCGFFGESKILLMSSTTWHQRRVDNIFLTIGDNKRIQRKGGKCYPRLATNMK